MQRRGRVPPVAGRAFREYSSQEKGRRKAPFFCSGVLASIPRAGKREYFNAQFAFANCGGMDAERSRG